LSAVTLTIFQRTKWTKWTKLWVYEWTVFWLLYADIWAR